MSGDDRTDPYGRTLPAPVRESAGCESDILAGTRVGSLSTRSAASFDVLGRFWFFLVLQDRDFAISADFSTSREQIRDVLRALKSLKRLVKPITA